MPRLLHPVSPLLALALLAPLSATADPAAPRSDFEPAVIPFNEFDLSWAPGSYAPPDSPLAWGPFHGEVRLDVPWHYSFSNPVDDTIVGSSEAFRHDEFQVTQIGFGGDLYYKGAHARLMTQFGLYSQTTPRNDPSPARGQWSLADAYRYVSEAYAGYHWNRLAGINVQAGIFMSYVGLWSYYNFDNWTYQPSYVSSNTPWFFDGVRIQIFPSSKLKIEPWLVNGWQAYGQFNQAPGVGLQIKWAPRDWLVVVGNQYFGTDTLGTPGRKRLHTDDSVMVKTYDHPDRFFDKAAVSLTVDAGCEFGDGNGIPGASAIPAVTCGSQYFVGFMAYTRLWFLRDQIGFTVGGGAISNPGRYLVIVPPINGATAYTGSPYWPSYDAGGKPLGYWAWDLQTTLDAMVTRNVTFRFEYTHRWASVPYFAGHGGVTPPNGAGSYVNQGAPGSAATNPDGSAWSPDLVHDEDRVTVALLFRI